MYVKRWKIVAATMLAIGLISGGVGLPVPIPGAPSRAEAQQVNWNQAQPAPLALWRVIHAEFPITRFLGIYVPRNVAGTNEPSLHAEGRALDIGLRADRQIEKRLADTIFLTLIDHAAELGLDHIIWNRNIWIPGQGLARYTGQSPHTDHIHVGFTRPGSQRSDFRDLGQRIVRRIRNSL